MNVVRKLMGRADITTTAQFDSTVSDKHEVQALWITEAITMGKTKNTTDARMAPEPTISPVQRRG